jgi:hypothetical protein
MKIDLARHVARAAFRSSRGLSELIPFLKDQLDAKEYEPYAKAIAAAVAAIQVDLMNKLLADHPGLEAEIEASIQKYDRYL